MTTQTEDTDRRDAETRRKQAVYLIVGELADTIRSFDGKFRELYELGVSIADASDLVIRQLPLPVQERLRSFDRLGYFPIPRLVGFIASWLRGEEMPDDIKDEFKDRFRNVFGRDHDTDPDDAQVPPFVEVGRTADTMRTTLERLWSEADTPEGQTPAIPVFVQLRSTSTPFSGALSQTEDGMLRMLSPSQVPGPGGRPQHALMEIFFDVADVVWISVQRDITTRLDDLTKPFTSQ